MRSAGPSGGARPPGRSSSSRTCAPASTSHTDSSTRKPPEPPPPPEDTGRPGRRPTTTTERTDMSDRPYTDNDLQIAAARLHAEFARQEDEVLVGEAMEKHYVPSLGEPGQDNARTWVELQEPE